MQAEINEVPGNEFIDIADLGVTMRTLLAIAGDRLVASGRRRYKIRYKHMTVGSVNVRPFKEGPG